MLYYSFSKKDAICPQNTLSCRNYGLKNRKGPKIRNENSPGNSNPDKGSLVGRAPCLMAW